MTVSSNFLQSIIHWHPGIWYFTMLVAQSVVNKAQIANNTTYLFPYQSQCPRSLRCRPAAARLLVRWVRTPPLLNFVCCQVEVSASVWSLVQRSATDCGVWTWSCSVDNEEALAQWGLLRNGKKESGFYPRSDRKCIVESRIYCGWRNKFLKFVTTSQ